MEGAGDLGHANPSTTMNIYGRVIPEYRRAGVLAMDELYPAAEDEEDEGL